MKRRGILRFGTTLAALTGASAISAANAYSAQAAPGDKNPSGTTSYVPIAEKGAASGVATLGVDSKIPLNQVPDLSTRFVPAGEPRPAVGIAFGITFATDPAWGMKADANTTSTDNGPKLQAILDYAAANYAATGAGLTIIAPGGDYGFATTVNLPVGPKIKIEGEDINPVGAAGVRGTRFRRKGSFTGQILRGVGTSGGYDASGRIRIWLKNIEFNGTNKAGTLVELARVSDSMIEHCRFFSNVGVGLRASEWFNSHIGHTYFHQLGNGRSSPAVLLDSPGPMVSGGAGGNTIHIIGCEWEGNTGTDLRITSNDASYSNGQDWTLAVLVTNCKMERNTGDYPLIDLDRVGDFHMSDSFLHLGPGCIAPHLEMKGTAVQPSRPVKISNTSFSGNKWTGTAVGGASGAPYFIDLTTGELLLANVSMNGSPTKAFIHIGPSVPPGSVRLTNVPVSEPSKLLHDERPGSTLNLGSVEVPARYVQQGSTAVAPTLTADQVVYKMLPAVKTDWLGSVTIPSDAATGRPIRIRVLWYTPGTGGNVRLEARAKPGLQGGSTTVSTAAEMQAVLVTAPATASQMVQTTFTFAATANPGQVVPVTLSRNGADATDTLIGFDVRIFQVELRYERAF
jgi:hypothetical protein